LTGDRRIPLLYLAPFVDWGGTDKGTIDWFRWVDRDRFSLHLITTQPSKNRWLRRVTAYADEVWPLPELMPGAAFPRFILDFIDSRGIELVHIMNSRLGFDLLPDICALPNRPGTIVQLHVEEHDRSGYVRHVSTRYEGLVDAFSVTSHQLAEAMVAQYDVPRSKCRVIHTGVDWEREFSRRFVKPIEGLPEGPVNILYPGRLVEQKDPLLMVDVAAALRDAGGDFHLHAVGEGELRRPVEESIKTHHLSDYVTLHGPTDNMAPWFAASEVTLMTSLFEGVPYVAYEAMAMEHAIVAPALPGNRELLDGNARLISPRDDREAYVEALQELIDDPAERRRLAARAHAFVKDHHSLQAMARAHETVYDELLSPSRKGDEDAHHTPREPPLHLNGRPVSGSPLVSAVVPCFNDGRFLRACLDSIRNQTYSEIEITVIDDASTDSDTQELLDELEHDETVRLMRQSDNQGPGAARNLGFEVARGRYLIPVDADNLLVPEAVDQLVNQLQGAGERVGFVYPTIQFFGNRHDLFEPPTYNLYALLEHNYCDTCSLIDRQVFDGGVRYSDDRCLAHEDWDFALRMAARGVVGEPARSTTLLFRKRGYSRGDTGWHGIHGNYRSAGPPELGEDPDIIKARYAPALSVLALEPVPDEGPRPKALRSAVEAQTCGDFELIAPRDSDWDLGDPVQLRRVPVAEDPAWVLASALERARGRYLLATMGSAGSLLRDPALVEKMLRIFTSNRRLGVIGFTDAGQAGRFPLQLLEGADGAERHAHALAWSLEHQARLPSRLELRSRAPIAEMAEVLCLLPTQWRHLPLHSPDATDTGRARVSVGLGGRPAHGPHERAERDLRMRAEALLPEAAPTRVPARVRALGDWMPTGTMILCRHVDRATGARVTTNEGDPPDGYTFERCLGLVQELPLPGTARLEIAAKGRHSGFRAVPIDGSGVDPDPTATVAGHVELVPFPLLKPLMAGVIAATGQPVLATSGDDPLLEQVRDPISLGYVESFPLNPPGPSACPDAVGLVRAVDLAKRRHVYGVGKIPDGQVAGELGSLLPRPGVGRKPVWLSRNGKLLPEGPGSGSDRPGLTASARWVLAPLRWNRRAPLLVNARAISRRAASSAQAMALKRPRTRAEGEPAGYLFEEEGPGRVPLFSADHPVLDDQLLSVSRLEASDMGYVNTILLGYLQESAPITGRLGLARVGVPWASRFGLEARG